MSLIDEIGARYRRGRTSLATRKFDRMSPKALGRLAIMELESLSDHMLADIGASRNTIRDYVRNGRAV